MLSASLKLLSHSRDLGVCVKVVPGARRSAVVGAEGESLKIRIAASPTDGRANQALIEFLSEWLEVPKSRIRIRSGATSRHKRLWISDYPKERFLARLP